MEAFQQVVPYTQNPICQIDATILIGALSVIMLLSANTKKQYQIAALERQQAMSQQHQVVLEEDIHDLEDTVSHLTQASSVIPVDNIQAAIISFIGSDRRGMKVNDIHHAIAESMPSVTKHTINSMLYTLGNNKILRKNCDGKTKAPVWTLV